LRVTTAEEAVPPATLGGVRTTDETVGGLTVRFADAFEPDREAPIAIVVLFATGLVPTENVVFVCPLGTVTVAGTVAALLAEVRATTAPLPPALALSVTLPVEVAPPKTEAGVRVTLETFWAGARAATHTRMSPLTSLIVEFGRFFTASYNHSNTASLHADTDRPMHFC